MLSVYGDIGTVSCQTFYAWQSGLLSTNVLTCATSIVTRDILCSEHLQDIVTFTSIPDRLTVEYFY